MDKINKIDEIINLVNEGKLEGDDGAYKKFENYLEVIKNLGKFDKNQWNIDWRLKIYDFGEIFKKKNAGNFIKILDEKIEENDKKSEIYEFIKSEILWNFFQESIDFRIEYLEELTKKYPYNPEFYHGLSHCLFFKKRYQEATEKNRMALKIEPNNIVFKHSCFNTEIKYFDFLLASGKLNEAENQIKKMDSFYPYTSDLSYKNFIVVLDGRLKDHKTINKKVID